MDCDAVLSELTPEAVRDLELLAPFGPGNPRPRIRLVDVVLASRPEAFGSDASHLSLMLKSPTAARTVRVVGWKWAEKRDQLAAGVAVEAVIFPRLNTWNGNTRVEPELADLRVC